MIKMEIKKLEKEARDELKREDIDMVKSEIKERLREIRSAEKVLAKLKDKYQQFLDKEIEDVLL